MPSRLVDARSHRKGVACVAAAAALWGLWPLWVRGSGHGLETASVALLVAGAGSLPWALGERRGRRRPFRPWALMAALGATDAANAGLYFVALERGAVAPAVFSHYLAPVLVALAAPWVLGEARARHTAAALAMALAGTAAMVLPGGVGGEGRILPGVAFGGASAIFYAANVLLSRHLAAWFGDRELLCYHALLSALLLFAAGGAPRSLASMAWVLLGSLPSALAAGMLFYAGLRRLRAEEAGVLTYVEPAVATLVGWLLLSEPLGLSSLGGGALVMAAGILVIAGGPSAARGAAEGADADAPVGPSAVGP